MGIEVQQYISESNLSRTQDPRILAENQKHTYPHFYKLALTFLMYCRLIGTLFNKEMKEMKSPSQVIIYSK